MIGNFTNLSKLKISVADLLHGFQRDQVNVYFFLIQRTWISTNVGHHQLFHKFPPSTHIKNIEGMKVITLESFLLGKTLKGYLAVNYKHSPRCNESQLFWYTLISLLLSTMYVSHLLLPPAYLPFLKSKFGGFRERLYGEYKFVLLAEYIE